MQIIHSEKYTEIKIPVDYCNVSLMRELCKIIVNNTESGNWILRGLYLNHALDDEEILSAESRLENLFYKKMKKMNVTEEKHFLEDLIVLTETELLDYFADFAIYYMEITVKPQNEVFAFPKIETEADANYIDIKINNNNKMCIDKLLKYMGIDKLKKIESENNNFAWNEQLFYSLKEKYSEIEDFIKYKSEILERHGLIKRKEYVKVHYWKKKMQLIFYVLNKNGDQLEIVLIEIRAKHRANRLQILFL